MKIWLTPVLGTSWFLLAAKMALVTPFVISAAAKLLDPAGALAEAEHFGLQPAILVVVATILVQLGGSLLILVGRAAWLGAGALAVFTVLATLIAHRFWTMTDPVMRFQNQNIFFEHIAIVGGLMLAAHLESRA